MKDVIGVQSGITHGTNLFLICQNGHSRIGRIHRLDLRHQRRIRAHSVILSISADHAAVQSHIAGLMGRNQLDLSAEEIRLGNPITLIQQLKRQKLNRLLDLGFIHIGDRSDDHIQFFALQSIL